MKCPIDEWACACAARNGHLEVLKYLREEAKAPWNWYTATWAAENGHLHILEYLVERKYDEYDECACAYAASNGHLDCLKYLHETAKAPWDEYALRSFRFPFPPPRRRGGCCSLLREREEEKEGEFFLQIGVVGFDREVRRYLFHSYFTEIESNGSQILVRSEYGDEKVGEEIVSEEGVEMEV